MPYVAHNYTAALVCMSVAIGFCSFHYSGVVVNVQDIAPKYTGSVYGEHLYCCCFHTVNNVYMNIYQGRHDTWPAGCVWLTSFGSENIENAIFQIILLYMFHQVFETITVVYDNS